MINGRGQIMLTVVTLLANKCRGLFCFADSAGRCFSGEFRQSFTSTSVECCLPSAAFIQACLVLLGMSRSDGHLGWVPFFSVPTTHCGSSRWRTYYIKAEVELRLFQLWCVAFGRPSITALTWCRGISWSGALNIFFDDWRRSIIWNGLTDRTSCFDRKLCTDWSWLCETSRFCSTETGVCGLMIHSLLGKLLNLSSLLTTPTVVQNCRCCVLSALSSSSSSSSSCV
ncbi:hypothetical protein T06_10912 [Trichinella sp. T6]|nr:hypothetical protein T06_10912 [Trichinella sp. T6]